MALTGTTAVPTSLVGGAAHTTTGNRPCALNRALAARSFAVAPRGTATTSGYVGQREKVSLAKESWRRREGTPRRRRSRIGE